MRLASSSSARESPGVRVYRLRRGWRAFLVGAGLALVALAVLTGPRLLSREIGPGWWFLFGSLLLVSLLGAWCVAFSWRGCIHLRDDTLTLREPPFRERTLRRTDIAGVRRIPTQLGSLLRFEPRHAGLRRIDLVPMYASDAVLDAWISGFEDLDEADVARHAAELERTLGLGHGRATLRSALVTPRAVARVLNGAAGAMVVWALVWPKPWVQLMYCLAALPVVTVLVALRWRRLFSLSEQRLDPRPSLMGPLLMPGLVLLIRSVRPPLVAWPAALGLAAGATVLLWAGALAADPHLRQKRGHAILAAAFLFPWGFGTVVQVDIWADHSAPEVHSTQVRSRRASSGKYREQLLVLAPWGPVHTEEEVSVRPDVFEGCQIGGEVAVHLRPGALGLPWYAVRLR